MDMDLDSEFGGDGPSAMDIDSGRESEVETKTKRSKLSKVLHGDGNVEENFFVQCKTAPQAVAKGMCIECEDQPADLRCMICVDDYCQVCFEVLHRRGSRRQHKTERLRPLVPKFAEPEPFEITQDQKKSGTAGTSRPLEKSSLFFRQLKDNSNVPIGDWWKERPSPAFFLERSKYQPLRLTLPQRKYMRLIKNMMYISPYTDKVDALKLAAANPKTQARRVFTQIKEVCATLAGMLVSFEYEQGQAALKVRTRPIHSLPHPPGAFTQSVRCCCCGFG